MAAPTMTTSGLAASSPSLRRLRPSGPARRGAGRRARAAAPRSLYSRPWPCATGMSPLFFYELHESDSDLFADVLLAHETEYDEAEFLELVLESRARVIEGFREDSLIEAIAADLAERAGFLVIDDSQLRVAVNVSARTTARSSRTSTATSRSASAVPGLPHAARGRRAGRRRLGRRPPRLGRGRPGRPTRARPGPAAQDAGRLRR